MSAKRSVSKSLAIIFIAVFALSSLLTACGNQPPIPDWQLNAVAASERAVQAYLTGQTRAEAQETTVLRREVARTGKVAQMARAELRLCAARVASLEEGTCPRFEALRADAPAAEVAYADYLLSRPVDPALLPPEQRVAATANNPAAIAAIADSLSRLVAAGVLLRRAQASPEVMQIAVDTASDQGWSRPLLAWLGVQARAAELAGQADTAARIRRRMDWVQKDRR